MSKLLLLDFDGTVVTTEGLDELAEHKLSPRSKEALAITTAAAMNGDLDFRESFVSRIETLRPSQQDCEWLATRYSQTVCPGAKAALHRLAEGGWRIAVVSGGLAQCIEPVARDVIPPSSFAGVVANRLLFDEAGNYTGIDSIAEAKSTTACRLRSDHAFVALLGDGANDAEAADAVDAFFCFTHVVRRPSVLRRAVAEVRHFDDLPSALAPKVRPS